LCRLVAYLGDAVSPADLVYGGSHSLFEQSWAPLEHLSGSVNADGYGVVWYAGGRPARIAEPRPIWHDPGLRRTLSAIAAECVIAALRNSTTGLPVDRSALTPFVHEQWTFVHNGFVPDFRRSHMRALRSLLPDDLYAELEGASDSETLFFLTLAALREGATPVEALESTARAVQSRVGKAEAQLNMLLSDGARIAAVRCGTVLQTNSLYVAVRPPLAPAGVVLASEPLDTSGVWNVVDGHSSVLIERDGAITTEMVFL
jgi:glutamine amidotransferase